MTGGGSVYRTQPHDPSCLTPGLVEPRRVEHAQREKDLRREHRQGAESAVPTDAGEPVGALSFAHPHNSIDS